MKIKRMELNNFKRFSHLIVEGLPETIKIVVLVGPNGSGKTSFMEAMNYFYQYSGYYATGDIKYLAKGGSETKYDESKWRRETPDMIHIDFHDANFKTTQGQRNLQGHFYFRSAYRNEAEFQIDSMQQQGDPTKQVRLSKLIQNDQTVSENYQRLIADTISGIYDEANDSKTVGTLRDELTGKIRDAIKRVFEDLDFSSLGDPLINGNFYFSKGIIKNFSYGYVTTNS